MTVLIVALPIVFQPELRRALEQIGRGRLFRKHGELDEYEVDEMVNSITSAAIVMGRRKIGALIVIDLKNASKPALPLTALSATACF